MECVISTNVKTNSHQQGIRDSLEIATDSLANGIVEQFFSDLSSIRCNPESLNNHKTMMLSDSSIALLHRIAEQDELFDAATRIAEEKIGDCL